MYLIIYPHESSIENMKCISVNALSKWLLADGQQNNVDWCNASSKCLTTLAQSIAIGVGQH